MNYSYHEVSKQRMTQGGSDPAKILRSIALLEQMIIIPMMEINKDAVWQWRRADHEIYNGAHYDKAFAMYDVAQMHHIANGANVVGEHWSLQQVQNVYDKHKSTIGKANVYDLYVALNGEWHDKIEMYKIWFGDAEKAENKVIESAISFYFMDADAPDGKVWKYHAKMM